MITESIEKLELEQKDDGCEVTIFYRHNYLPDTETLTAKLFIPNECLLNAPPIGGICDFFYEIGIIFGIEKGKNLDWRMIKDVPDEHLKKIDTNNYMAVAEAPGRVFWKADGYR